MGKDKYTSEDKFSKLREQAEDLLAYGEKGIGLPRLVHELRTHQIELELQNEELRRAQEELLSSQNKYLDLYDYAPVGYLTIGDKGLIIETNLTAAAMFGLDRAHLLNQPLSAFIINEDQDTYYKCRKDLLQTKEPQTFELILKKKDGSTFNAHLMSGIRFDADDSLGQFRVAITDISERKKLENNLLQSKKEWEMTFDAMSDLAIMMDKDLRIIRANKATHDLFKVELGSLNGQYCYQLFQGESSPCTECPAVKTIEDSRNHFDEYIEHKKLGKIFHATCASILDEKGKLKHLIYTAKDVTEINKLQLELQQAQKMEAIGTMAGGIAHDFNNILAIILGYSEIALKNIPSENPARNSIKNILKAADRAIILVRQILAFSRKEKRELLAIPIQSMIKETLKLLRSTTPSTVSIIQAICEDCGMIMADPTQLHQLLVNLFTNAVHAIDEKGEVTVSLQEVNLKAKALTQKPELSPGAYVCLAISDTGAGMDQEIIARIFDPFFTTKETGKGTGMGLSIIHGIVESHGGFIDVESELGQGSTFNIFFPVTEDGKEDITEVETTTRLQTGTERILLVDDEEMILDLADRLLENLGYEVIAERSSLKALEIFKSNPDQFDLILTDQSMPDMSGVEFVAEILKERPGMPIILCTGYSSKVSVENAREKGISKYITKPYSQKELAKTVREVLDAEV